LAGQGELKDESEMQIHDIWKLAITVST